MFQLNHRSPWRFQAILMSVLCLGLMACGGSRGGALTDTTPITFLGIEASHMQAWDTKFVPNDVINGKLPSWNAELAKFMVKKSDFITAHDISTSQQRFASVDAGQIHSNDNFANTTAPALAADKINSLVKPYLGGNGNGMIIIPRILAKNGGTLADYVVFNRETGAIVLHGSGTAKNRGIGVRNYYLNGIKGVAKQAMDSF